MSFWSSRRSPNGAGRTEITSIPCAELVLFGCMFGVPLVLLMAAPLAFGPPQAACIVICGLLGVGMALFLTAKVSVIRRGHLTSFGSAHMSAAMRRCYTFGYLLCGTGLLLALGTLRWWAAG